ncbi:fungal hydrophobin-domain-containing protein [Hygrophoropsis aurantiaca]|uniref:Fungal hydrophobin-domain-containing protein n=1 Tax=Hygrophoropsis aurantiaca TaxID=72124 RepID=A0ACB7ZWZ6_9AGAM|nr:fungal hydrophobin-domain-containing protein [Hygrophoropsis aurantiaca]
MFARLSTVVVASSLALLAVATGSTGSSQCNTGSAYCCDSVQSATSSQVTTLAALLGIVLGDITGQVGLTCSPLTIIGTGSGADCNQEPVCCTNDQFNGLINLGCSPLNLNL